MRRAVHGAWKPPAQEATAASPHAAAPLHGTRRQDTPCHRTKPSSAVGAATPLTPTCLYPELRSICAAPLAAPAGPAWLACHPLRSRPPTPGMPVPLAGGLLDLVPSLLLLAEVLLRPASPQAPAQRKAGQAFSRIDAAGAGLPTQRLMCCRNNNLLHLLQRLAQSCSPLPYRPSRGSPPRPKNYSALISGWIVEADVGAIG